MQITESLPLSVDLGTLHAGLPAQRMSTYTHRARCGRTPRWRLTRLISLCKRSRGIRCTGRRKARLSLVGVSPQLPTVPLPVTQWEANFAVDDAALRLEAHGTAFDAAVTLASRLEYAFATQAGSAHLQLSPVRFDPSHLSWRKMVPLESFPIDVTAVITIGDCVVDLGAGGWL